MNILRWIWNIVKNLIVLALAFWLIMWSIIKYYEPITDQREKNKKNYIRPELTQDELNEIELR